VIPFLLQHRLAGAGETPPTVTNPPDWSGLTFRKVAYALAGTVTATSSFTINPDGSWIATDGSGTVGGYWINPHAAGVGSGYKVQFVVTGSVGSGTVANGASGIVSLSAARSFSVQVSTSVSGTVTCQRAIRVDIYDASDVLVASGSATLYATAEKGT